MLKEEYFQEHLKYFLVQHSLYFQFLQLLICTLSGGKRQTFLSYVEVMRIHYSTKEKNNEEREKKEQGEKLCERKGESKTQIGLKLLIL